MRSEKKPERVVDGVYQVGGPDMSDGRDCCVYLVDGGGTLALIDCGCGPGYGSIVANITRAGFEPADLGLALLTHCHIDHVGGAARFRGEYGVELIAHELDARPLEEGDSLTTAAFLYGIEFKPLPIDRKLTGDRNEIEVGDVLLEVLWTPGHSPGSVAAYLDADGVRVLFGQDIHGPFHPDFGSDIRAWRESMAKLLELEADILCEGHFGVISPASAVRSYIDACLDQFA